MVQNTISTAIMIIAAVVAAVALVSAIYPTLYSSSRTLLSTTSDTDSRSNSLLTMTTYGFVNSTALDVWAKNSGRNRISLNELEAARVYYGNDSGSMTNYAASVRLEEPHNSDSYLDPGETVKVEITGSLPQNPGVHRIRLALPNGATSEYTLTI